MKKIIVLTGNIHNSMLDFRIKYPPAKRKTDTTMTLGSAVYKFVSPKNSCSFLGSNPDKFEIDYRWIGSGAIDIKAIEYAMNHNRDNEVY